MLLHLKLQWQLKPYILLFLLDGLGLFCSFYHIKSPQVHGFKDAQICSTLDGLGKVSAVFFKVKILFPAYAECKVQLLSWNTLYLDSKN